mmetsp:Transcript_7923/g.19260  ORF Transcript_7923/g.19260 Transcript_7923/m.19260 type:complete len:535 (-) Transcript_7923:206-1810(-)
MSLRSGRLNTGAREAVAPQEVSDKWAADSNPYDGMDPVFLALSRLRRRKWDATTEVASELLGRNAFDQQVWWIKCRALTSKNWVDDTEVEEEGLGELLLDDNATAQLPRPGTSLNNPQAATSGPSPAVRPTSQGGRPLSGFVRPGTGSARPGSGVSLERALTASRIGTAMTRPVTTSGRFIRLGTASMQSEPGGAFININKVNVQKYAERPAMCKALCDYMLHVEHAPKRAAELAAAATTFAKFKDWWWKARLGKAYYQMGLLRDSEQQLLSSIKEQPMVTTYLQLANIYLRLDQPNKALETLAKGSARFGHDVSLLLAQARVHDAVNAADKAVTVYKQVLSLDASNVESVACLASFQFYSDQPEVALRYYRRLLQMGCDTPALWSNLGLCCFGAGQYDMCLTCFDKALQGAGQDTLGDIWYNISHVAIGIGDLGLAYQALKVAVAADPNHAEAHNNLAVLELKKGNLELSRSGFREAARLGPFSFEPPFNSALLAHKLGETQESFDHVNKALECWPEHTESKELIEILRSKFT